MAPANPANSSSRSRIAQHRLRLGLGQNDLATRSGVPLSTLRKYEQRETDRPALRVYLALAEALGVSVEQLIEPEWRRSEASASPDAAAQRL